MEHIVDSEHGTTALLAGVIIVLCLHLVVKIAEVVWEVFKKKGELVDAVEKNQARIEQRLITIERDLNEILKFRKDFQFLYSCIKTSTGKRWPEVKKRAEEEQLVLKS
jgi:hypothetical protein